jgi:hypothetical protein
VPRSFIQYSRGGEVTCPHGGEECTANGFQACVARHAPEDKNYAWVVKFLVCTWDSGLPVYAPETVSTCLDQVGAGSGGGVGWYGLGAGVGRTPARALLWAAPRR